MSYILVNVSFSCLLRVSLESLCFSVLSTKSLLDLIIYVPSAIFQLNRDGSPWVEPVQS